MKAGPKRQISVGPLYTADLPKSGGERVIAFVQKYLTVPSGKGAGHEFVLERWQQEIVHGLFDDPRPRSGLLSLPRGNGKSTLAAALAIYSLFADKEPSPQVLIVASDQRQAGIIFDAARSMIEDCPPLHSRAVIYADRIVVPETNGVMMAMPSEAGAMQGWNPTLMLCDELAHVTDDVWEAVTSASGKRAKSLTLAISTPAPERDSVMYRLVDYGRGTNDPSFYFKEYGADKDDDADDPAVWLKANPAMNPALGRPFLFEDGMRAVQKTMRPSQFKRLRLGAWVGGEDSWIDWDDWKACKADKTHTPEPGTDVVLAFDGSASGDSTALVGCTLDQHIFVIGLWENPGDPRWRVDRTHVAAVVEASFDKWNVIEAAFDPWGFRTEIEQWSQVYGGRVVEYPTNVLRRMGPASDRFYQAVKEKTLTHDGDTRLAAHIEHCVAKSTPYGDLVTKHHQKSPKKIDAAIAAVVAFDRAEWHRMNKPKQNRWAVQR